MDQNICSALPCFCQQIDLFFVPNLPVNLRLFVVESLFSLPSGFAVRESLCKSLNANSTSSLCFSYQSSVSVHLISMQESSMQTLLCMSIAIMYICVFTCRHWLLLKHVSKTVARPSIGMLENSTFWRRWSNWLHLRYVWSEKSQVFPNYLGDFRDVNIPEIAIF